MIVGNGPVPDSAANAIASADCVIRFNDCRSYRPGERTDIVAVCNTGRPAKMMLGTSVSSALHPTIGPAAWGAHPAVVEATGIWCVRNPAVFAALRAPLAITHPELDDFCDDETAGFEAFALAAGKTFRVLDAETQRFLETILAGFSPAPYIVPSSGIVVIADMLGAHPAADIALAGFAHVGWEGHPFAAEAQLVDRWIAEGRLRRLDAAPALSLAVGS
ncbi:Urease operon accessory protein [Rhizobiaceae bacterium CRRU44]|uniref:Urease operon accessory protein n=1 Tax=Ferranicluibacter rubi TaxID=2715133 RepID=A0AA43ZI04_9HYPH|nr:Urease operon accessory protein [Ferranicluibacter rubi]